LNTFDIEDAVPGDTAAISVIIELPNYRCNQTVDTMIAAMTTVPGSCEVLGLTWSLA